ncbi:alkene reductase, partial [Xanthomonas oryzae pv. oryzae]
MITFDWLLMSKSTQSPLFSPVRLGALDLANRVVMAPLTRNRAIAGQVPSP